MKFLIAIAFLAVASAIEPEWQRPSFLPLIVPQALIDEAQQAVKVVEAPEPPVAVNVVEEPRDVPTKVFEPLRPSELDSLYVEIPDAPPRRPGIVYDNPYLRGANLPPFEGDDAKATFDAPPHRPGIVFANPLWRGGNVPHDAPPRGPGKVYTNPFAREGHNPHYVPGRGPGIVYPNDPFLR